MAFAVRCAVRAYPLIKSLWYGAPEEVYRAVKAAIELAAAPTVSVSSLSPAISLVDRASTATQDQSDRYYADARTLDNDPSMAADDIRAGIRHSAGKVRTASNVCLCAASAARAASSAAAGADENVTRHTLEAMDHAARSTGYEIETRIESMSGQILADFSVLCSSALAGSWDDAIHVPQDVFDPIWPQEYQRELGELARLYKDLHPPSQLIEVADVISAELIRYLRKHPRELYRIRPRQFEELVAEILASFRWDVQLTPAVRDGGYDIFAITKDFDSGVRTSWIIECKKYAPTNKVGVEVVRSLYGVKSDLRVANALLVTSSSFTKGVFDFQASRYDIELRDYRDVIEWLNQYRPNPNGKLYLNPKRLVIPSG